MRVMVLSHMHPALSRGGAEIAAYQIFRQLGATPGVEALFVAASGGKLPERLGARLVQPFGPGEYVYCGTGFDHFNHANPDPLFPREFMALVRDWQPDLVHLHHYANFGVEVLRHIREAAPKARIVLTLHEYLAICNHFGQMVKRPGFSLCERSGPRDCARCFPEHAPQDFFLRELYLKRFLGLVDHFVAPSRFLASRYVAWGLPEASFSVIENGMPEAAAPGPSSTTEPPAGDLVLGFFGQVSRLKGIDVVLEAARLLDREEVSRIRFEVHGDHSNQPPAMRDEFEARLAAAPPNFEFFGPYENGRVRSLMRGVSAVLVPSIWWENSPLVIQEALLARRPVLCSDIGGMAEKVRHGLDGYHFRAGSGRALASLAKELLAAPERLTRLQATMATPPMIAETAAATLKLYRRLAKRPARRQPARDAEACLPAAQ